MSDESTPPASAPQPPSADGRSEFVRTSVFPYAHLLSIGAVGQLVTFVVLSWYVLGLLVVNMYLYQIGVSDFSVLRTRFVLTGFLAVLPLIALLYIFLAVAMAVAGLKDYRHTDDDQSGDRLDRLHAFLNVGGVLSVFISALGAIWIWADSSNIDFRFHLFWSLGINVEYIFMFLTLVPTVVSFSLGKLALTDMPRSRRPLAFQFWGMLFGVLLQVGFFGFLYIDFFASTFYPITPEQFGGGRPKEVVIVLAPESNPLGTALGFAPVNQGPITRQVDLLWETEQMYVVRDRDLPEAPIVQIDRDAVSAVVLGSSIGPASPPVASPLATPEKLE